MVLDNTHMSYRSPMVSNTNGQYGYGQNNGYNNQQGMYNNRGQNQGYNNGNPNPIAQGIYWDLNSASNNQSPPNY